MKHKPDTAKRHYVHIDLRKTSHRIQQRSYIKLNLQNPATPQKARQKLHCQFSPKKVVSLKPQLPDIFLPNRKKKSSGLTIRQCDTYFMKNVWKFCQTKAIKNVNLCITLLYWVVRIRHTRCSFHALIARESGRSPIHFYFGSSGQQISVFYLFKVTLMGGMFLYNSFLVGCCFHEIF